MCRPNHAHCRTPTVCLRDLDGYCLGSVRTRNIAPRDVDHDALVADVFAVVETACAAGARSIGTVLSTYWRVGQANVERELGGAWRPEYGGAPLGRLANTPTARYGRGFSKRKPRRLLAVCGKRTGRGERT